MNAQYIFIHINSSVSNRGYLRGIMVKAKDCRIVVSEFELQSHYCVHFWANTLGSKNTTTVFLDGWLWH